jgi:hypothetical protein
MALLTQLYEKQSGLQDTIINHSIARTQYNFIGEEIYKCIARISYSKDFVTLFTVITDLNQLYEVLYKNSLPAYMIEEYTNNTSFSIPKRILYKTTMDVLDDESSSTDSNNLHVVINNKWEDIRFISSLYAGLKEHYMLENIVYFSVPLNNTLAFNFNCKTHDSVSCTCLRSKKHLLTKSISLFKKYMTEHPRLVMGKLYCDLCNIYWIYEGYPIHKRHGAFNGYEGIFMIVDADCYENINIEEIYKKITYNSDYTINYNAISQ